MNHWESATAEACLQALLDWSTFLSFEHTFGRWHLTTRDCSKFRDGREIGCPSGFAVSVAVHDWHSAASNRQGRLVLEPSLIVMERRLVEILYQEVVSEDQVGELPN